MNAPLSAGMIGVTVGTSRGVVCAVEVKSQRPQALQRLFDGRKPAEAPRLAGQLFSLCGFSQATAAKLAVARAQGIRIPEGERRSAVCGLLAEHIFETMRSIAMQWPGKLSPHIHAQSGVHLREAMKATRTIIAEADSDRLSPQVLEAASQTLWASSISMGICGGETPPQTSNLVAAVLQDIEGDEVFSSMPSDALSPDDDLDVVNRLVTDVGYAARPSLPGRVVETGAFARRGAGAPSDLQTKTLKQRFLARIRDIERALDILVSVAKGKDDVGLEIMNDGVVGKAGFGAVECARGRLYHAASLDGDGRLAQYRIVAPTEWNFHPAGPFVETLLSARIGSGDAARQRIAKLAALFDPCVAFDIELNEIGHA